MVGAIPATGTVRQQGVAGLCAGRPGPCDALVAVDHEVDREGSGRDIREESCVGAYVGHVFGREHAAEGADVERLGVFDARLEEDELDVAVGGDAVGEGREVVAGEPKPPNTRGDRLGAGDVQVRGDGRTPRWL